jgi:hypothetical protein
VSYQLITTGIIQPPGFNGPVYDAVNQVVSARAPNIWRTFALAWIAVSYRYKAALEYELRFTASIAQSSGPDYEERFRQDHDLFGFVVCAVSVIECLHFAAYCIASVPSPTDFPLMTAKDLKFFAEDVGLRLVRAFPVDRLALVSQRVLNSPEFARLKEWRIVLFHRGTPPRVIALSTSGQQPASIPDNLRDLSINWAFTLPLDASTGPGLVTWLKREVDELIRATEEFATRYL